MKAQHLDNLQHRCDELLVEIDEDTGNPQWCYEGLAKDMAKAAAAVYDSCMKGQAFAERQKRRE